MNQSRLRRRGALFAGLCIVLLWSAAAFADVVVPQGYSTIVRDANAGGDFDYLPNGDIVGISYSFTDPKLYLFDFNGDGSPVLPQVLLTLPSGAYGSIVKVSPDGSCVLVGFNGADNSLKKVSLTDYSIEHLTVVHGNYDAAFIDDSQVLVSANRGGWDSTKPNEILLMDINKPKMLQVIARIADTPSGAIAINSIGDLYYIKSTWAYPAPAGSYTLMKFSAEELQDAISGSVLSGSDSSVSVAFDSGADLEVVTAVDGENTLFVATFGGEIYRLNEPDLVPELFISHDASGEVGSFVKLALHNPQEMFVPNHGFGSKLAAAYATGYYTVHQVLEIAPDDGDVLHERLDSRACVGANGYLGQVNIVSVINRINSALPVSVEYYDLSGALKGSVQGIVGGRLKGDFIINELGLETDSYGTVCVTVDGPAGSWGGGIALYKPNQRLGSNVFGDGFDFALYYPFSNAKEGRTTVPLNTYHLGTDVRDTVANWIALSDAVIDGKKLRGTLVFYNAAGSAVHSETIAVPDGGRQDVAGHLFLTGGLNIDAVGMAEFIPDDEAQQYYIAVTRYFYDCQGAVCNDFLTAFAVPDRPGTSAEVSGGVTTADGLVSVVELNNTDPGTAVAEVAIHTAAGTKLDVPPVAVAERGTRHIIVNESGEIGFLAADSDGSSSVQTLSGAVSALHMMYRLSDAGVLEEAFAAPLVSSPGMSQVSQFNTFINHLNTTEVCNTSSEGRSVTLSYVDVDGVHIHQEVLTLGGNETRRFMVPVLPRDTFGSVLVEADGAGVVVRNYVSRPKQYTLAFGGN